MVLRGRGAFLQKGPSPPKLPERLAPPAPKAFPCGLQTDSGCARAGPTKTVPADGGMKRSGKPKRGTWAYPELKNAQGTKKNGRHCSGDWL